jgi:hypothetical protein
MELILWDMTYRTWLQAHKATIKAHNTPISNNKSCQ